MSKVKCSDGHHICTTDDSKHPPKATLHKNVFLLSCRQCGTSVHVYMVGNYRIQRTPTKSEMLIAYGFDKD